MDNAGNRISRTPLPSGTATNYGYDAIYELLSAAQGNTTNESYTYDAVGNRLSALGSATWAYNSSNELGSRPGVTYTYDNNGNTLTKVASAGTTTYAWDFENRLTSVTLPGTGGTVSFKYDPLGRRIEKTTSSATSIYAYDGDNLIEETDSSGTAVARYSQGLNVDEPLAMLRGATADYYEADGLGSVTSLTNSSAAIAATYTYDSFGNLTASTGTLTNPFRYTARESVTETGLYYYRARYYDSATARFLSQDPIGFGGGGNFYTYVFNDPLNLSDPFGLATYVIIVGQPGGPGHYLGNTFNLAAATAAAELTANGDTVSIAYAASIQDFNNALNQNGNIDGGVIYFGHIGRVLSPDGADVMALAPGSAVGADTNVAAYNVNQLSNAHLAASAIIKLWGCHGGLAWGGKPSIAQVLANRLRRRVYASDRGVFFSGKGSCPKFSKPGSHAPSSLPVQPCTEGGAPLRAFSPQ